MQNTEPGRGVKICLVKGFLTDGGRARQLLTTWLMNDVLKPRRSAKAAALLGFVANDVWGGPDWNWQYGQASLSVRVGVWSLFRNGGPHGDDAEKMLCLVRTMKTAVHEKGHILASVIASRIRAA